jgi:hypothetical protein
MEDGPNGARCSSWKACHEDGCVWISSIDAGGWHHNLGPADKVAEVVS